MRITLLLTLAGLILLPLPADAQVRGAIIIGGYPVGGIIYIGEPVPSYPRRVVIVAPTRPRVLVVEHWKRHRHDRYCHHDHDRRQVVWYDRSEGGYYDRYRRGLVEIEVIAHDGRYYRR
jgi:hypothetical protein